MGWTFTRREKGEATNLEWFRREFAPSDPERLLDGATVKGVFYGAFRRDDGSVTALVVPIRWTRDYFNFGYKDMDESVGPYATDAPERILNLLTAPAPNADAVEWRVRAWAKVTAAKERPKVKAQDVVRFAEPITFTDGTVADTFVYVGRGNRFYGTKGFSRFSISGWREREFEVVEVNRA